MVLNKKIIKYLCNTFTVKIKKPTLKLPLLNFTKKLVYLIPAILLLIAGCDLEKPTRFNRSMQNLTAHYNILFNANEILDQKQLEYATANVDAYDHILSVYPDTTAKTASADKLLESVVARANTIISVKEQSHYIGDAYLVLGKANYLEGNFFNAIEFLSQVIRAYPKQKNLVQEARVWKARSYMRINQLNMADSVLDTAMLSIFPKQTKIADIYATRLQYDIYAGKFADAETMAKQAIHYSKDVNHQLRWTFILAQVEEKTKHFGDAIHNYDNIINSNASYEMAFNASLNKIAIQQDQSTARISRIDALRILLKDEKNKEFADQIYFQIGELYLAKGDVENAVKNFKLSIRKSVKNLNQKGLSYLRIADIDFKYKADYTGAKKYYDSTLTALSPNYPGYQAVFKKANNLQLLTDKLQIITREDTLQMLAKMDESARMDKIAAMAKAQIAAQKAISINNAAKSSANNNAGSFVPSIGSNSGVVASTFYFDNVAALSQGFTDFKRVWGSRPLADNWRRSVRSGNDINSAQAAATIQNLNAGSNPAKGQKSATDVISDKIQQDLLANIPLTPSQLVQSNTRILNAYMDIASFYRDILDDKKEAIETYELILARFPGNNNKVSVYYNLYRLYSDIDAAKSEKYKNLILKDYPESNFAKVILDPDFNQKLNDKNAEYTAFYNQLFDEVSKRKYTEAIDKANEMITQYPTSPLNAQVYYLRTIAQGHGQKLDPFVAELKTIADKFPDDRLVTPLVLQHLAYIDAHKDDLSKRDTVLEKSDPNEIPFLLRPIHIDQTYIPKQVVQTPIIKPAPKASTTTPAVSAVTPPVAGNAKPAETNKVAPSIFALSDSTNYYFVVNVATNTVSLAPSRFGIGQFNRANLPAGSPVKHDVKPVGTHQLLFVGRFSSLARVKEYARAIVPLLPDIMKVPADKYTFFIITRQNLDKLADEKTLNSYFDFYQQKY